MAKFYKCIFLLILSLLAFAIAMPVEDQVATDDPEMAMETLTPTATPDDTTLAENSVVSEVRIREIVREEIAIGKASTAIDSGLPEPVSFEDEAVVELSPLGANETFRRLASSQKITMLYGDGRRFTFDENDAKYRATTLPTTMCSVSSLASTTASNLAAFVQAHNTKRSQLNSCKWKVPKPSPALASTTSSKEMAGQANTWAQHLKKAEKCGLVHSTSNNRTVTFKLDNGTQLTKAYTGENLASVSVCMTTSDTANFDAAKATYCSNGYLYTAASNSWWGEIASYSAANGGKFVTENQLNALNSNPKTQVGHWTQMAWDSSTVIAGATAECSKTSVQTFTCSPPGVGECSSDGKIKTEAICYTWVTVGRYYKGGNIAGQTPYKSKGAFCNPSG